MNPDTNKFEPLHEETCTPEQKQQAEDETNLIYCWCGRPCVKGHTRLCATHAQRERRGRK
jgi:hypothetical protein